jgi:hypothetical protein
MGNSVKGLVALLLLAVLCSSLPTVVGPQPIGEVGLAELQFEMPDPAAFDNVTVHEGDLLVGDDSTLMIENCLFNISGTLIVRGTGRVVIRNALFASKVDVGLPADLVNGRLWRTRHIVVEEDGQLEASDCDFVFLRKFPIVDPDACGFLLFDQAVVTLTRANFIPGHTPPEFLYLYNNSRLQMENVVLSTFNPGDRYTHPNSGVWSWDEAALYVQSSVLDEIIFLGNCTARLHALQTEYIQTSNRDTSQIRAFDSTIDQLFTWPSSRSRIWLENSTVGDLMIQTGSTVWLHNSLETKDYHDSKGAVFIVWDIPLIGQLAIPYGWAPYVLPTIAVLLIGAIVATSVTFVLFVRRNRRRHRNRRRSS